MAVEEEDTVAAVEVEEDMAVDVAVEDMAVAAEDVEAEVSV